MFVPVTANEKYEMLSRASGSFIPGYTGHCPTLRFHFGKCYGARTKEIMQDLRDKGVYKDVERYPYRADDPGKVLLKPIERSKGQTRNLADDAYNRCPKYILGYTGFIPTINFRYGKSFGRAADDSLSDFRINQSRVRQRREEIDKVFRTKSAPRMTSIRQRDDVTKTLQEYEDRIRFREKEISSECPPIAGYTGHIPRVKGNEESLSQRYNTVVKRGLSILKQEKEKREELNKAKYKITEIFEQGEGKYTYKDM